MKLVSLTRYGAILAFFLACSLTDQVWSQHPLQFNWIAASEIIPGRYYHTTTLLSDGRVIVTGGRSGSTPLRSVRIFDPHASNAEWVLQHSLSHRRERHTATLMPAGWILIAGGLDNVPMNKCEFLDPLSQNPLSLPDMHDVRYEHTATYLRGGRVLVVGSKDYDRGLPSCEIFESLETATAGNPRWRWRRTAPLHFGRGKHRAVTLLDGRILVIGGVHNYAPTITCELFDPATETWSLAASMHIPREGHTATLLADGRVLVTGGDMGGTEISSCEVFDPTKNNGKGSWSMWPNTNIVRKNHTATLINNRYVLIAGAWRIGHGSRSTEIIDTWHSSPNWQTGPSMLAERSNHSSVLLDDGRLLLIGGEILGNQEGTSECDISDNTLNTFTAPVPHQSALESIAPNPFTDRTIITLTLASTTASTLTIIDALGRPMRTLPIAAHAPGRFSVFWDGRSSSNDRLPAGLYYLILRSNHGMDIKPLHLLR